MLIFTGDLSNCKNAIAFYPFLSHPDPGRRQKIKLNVYLYISLWRLKRFCEGLQAYINIFMLI